jgi:hypothetical protein
MSVDLDELEKHADPRITQDSLWRRRAGREVLRIKRHWLATNPAEWCVRGHPITGGKPLICPDAYLLLNYEPVSASFWATR